MRLIAIARMIAAAAVLWLGAMSAAEACVGLGCSCSVTTQNVAFGTYDPLSGSPNDAAGRVTVNCSALVALFFSYDIKLSAGGGTYAARRMSVGANQIGYQLYTDAAHTVVWGDGTASTSIVSMSYNLTVGPFSRTDNFPVRGRIPSGQNVKVGDYADTILVTVVF